MYEIVGPLPVRENHQSHGQVARIPNLERTETIKANTYGPVATLSTIEVLNVAISIAFGTHAAIKASKHILESSTGQFFWRYSAVLFAVIIAFSGTIT
jgi:hypothetical protein